MPATHVPNLAESMVALPKQGTGRTRKLQRLVDVHAAAEAEGALEAAAAPIRGDAGVLARALRAAAALLGAPDDAARDELRDAVAAPELLALIPGWIRELRQLASFRPDSGACTIASALELWSWTVDHFRVGEGARTEWAANAIDELATAAAPLLAARALALEVGMEASMVTQAEGELRSDLCHVYAAHASALAGLACAELVFGYRRHLVWDEEGCASCWSGDDLDDLEALMPGIASGARMSSDVVEADGSHPSKRGPCASLEGVTSFTRLRSRLDGCLTGARLAKDRAAAAIGRSLETTMEGRAR